MMLKVLFFFVYVTLVLCDCPHGSFQGIDSSTCYKFFAASADFYSAEANCESINGYLASISNAFENAILYTTLKQILVDPKTQVWLGGNKPSDTWVWSDSNPWAYTNWKKGEPQSGQNCLFMTPADGKWHAGDCSSQFTYICEVPSSSGATCPPVQTCPISSPIFACESLAGPIRTSQIRVL